MSDDKYGETRVQVITDIDDTVKSSGGLRLLGKLGRALALFPRTCRAVQQEASVLARAQLPMPLSLTVSAAGCV